MNSESIKINRKKNNKKKILLISILVVVLFLPVTFVLVQSKIISIGVDGIKFSMTSSFDKTFSNNKMNLLTLRISKQEGFEKYFIYTIKQINQSSWEVSYNLDSKVLKDINDCNKLEKAEKNKCIDNISEKYSEKEVADNISVKNSILNIENYPVNSTYQNILVDNKKINLSKNGKFIITIDGFDSSNVEKYNHNKIKVGFSSTEFEIIIYVSNAQHLDKDRVFISDITDAVKYKDGIWSEEIKSDEYARITFEHKINSSRDITLYAKGTNAIIDVYEKDGTTILAEYPIINSEGFYKIYLTNLTGEQDTFDLKTQSGKIEYDWIVDPSGDINISFITPTVSSFTTNNTNVTINISIVTDILSKFIFNWNGTNLTIYDNASRLILGFNNLSSLGENDSVAVDVGYQKVNATFNNSVTWISDGKYGGAYNFTGLAGSYMSLGNTFAVVSPYQYSYCLWFRPASFSVPNQTLIGRFSATGTRTDYAMIVVNGSQIAFSKDNGVDLTDILSIWNVPNMNVESWHHFCIVAYNQSTVGAYFDGLSYGNKTTEYIDQGSAGLYIGNGLVSRFATNGETTLSNFNGTIDEVRFINKSLSSDEVQNMYMRNFFEYNTTRWYFYINQSKNVTAGLDNGTYSYQAFGYDLTNILNYTELRNVTINTSYTEEIPAINPQINFTYPTPPNETSTTNTSFIVNISISSSTLNSTIFNWNGTNFTIYNNSLVAMYNFENFSTLQENSTKATDLSLAGNNATLHATTLISNGKFGNALSFTDSSSSYLDTQIDSSGTNAVTISMWVNRTWGLGARVLFESSSNFNLVDTGFGVFPDNSADCSTSYPTYVATKGDVSFNTRCYAQPSSGVWHYLTFVFDRSQNGANEIKYYIDGVLQTAGITPATNDNNNNFGNNAFYLMSRAGSSLYCNGTIDNFRYWNRALTASEINELYMINLQKFNSTQWYLYVNQTKNSTNGLDLGTYSYQGFITNASGNSNQTEKRSITILDIIPPTCVVLSRTPADINDTSSGIFNVVLNCSDSSGINISLISGSSTEYNAFITRTLEGYLTPGLPNRWSIRPPSNNLASNDSLPVDYGQIFRAFNRGENNWFEFLNTSNMTGDNNLSSWLLYDNYSYAVGDGKYGYFNISYESPTNAIINYTHPSVRFSTFRQNIPLSYESLISESKKNVSINKNLQLLVYRNDLEAMKGSKNYTITVFRDIGTTPTAPTAVLRVFYCNSSYSPTGGVTVLLSPNCVSINAITPTSLLTKVLTDRNSSYSQGVYAVTDGKIGGIVATPYHYYYYDTLESNPNRAFQYAYANGTTNTNVSFNDTKRTWTSGNNGVIWTQLNGTLDLMEFTIKSNDDEFQFGYCVYDLAGNIGCNKTLFVDEITATNHPISNPFIVEYNSTAYLNDLDLNETHKGIMNIRIGCAKDPDSVGNVTHNLTLNNLDGSWNYTINSSFLCPGDVQTWINFNTSLVPNANYKMNVTATSGDNINDIESYLTFNNFTINNTVLDIIFPQISIISPANNTNSNNNNLNVNYNVSDNIGISSCWYSNDSYSVNTTLVSCANITTVTWSEGFHNVRIYVNDTSGNENSTMVRFRIDTIPPHFINLANQSLMEGSSLNYDINAADNSGGVGFGSFAINWTTTFSINLTNGILKNISALQVYPYTYWINVSINDTVGNLNSSIFALNIVPFVAPSAGGGNIIYCRWHKFGYYNPNLPVIQQQNCI